MKVSPVFIVLAIVGSAQARTRRRHLNTIKGDESDASMSYASTLYAAKGSSSRSRSKSSPTLAPKPPPPAVSSSIEGRYFYHNIVIVSLSLYIYILTTPSPIYQTNRLVNVDLLSQKVSPLQKILIVIVRVLTDLL